LAEILALVLLDEKSGNGMDDRRFKHLDEIGGGIDDIFVDLTAVVVVVIDV
jgi:hypothetical protein